jgi:hypothetical protein
MASLRKGPHLDVLRVRRVSLRTPVLVVCKESVNVRKLALDA